MNPHRRDESNLSILGCSPSIIFLSRRDPLIFPLLCVEDCSTRIHTWGPVEKSHTIVTKVPVHALYPLLRDLAWPSTGIRHCGVDTSITARYGSTCSPRHTELPLNTGFSRATQIRGSLSWQGVSALISGSLAFASISCRYSELLYVLLYPAASGNPIHLHSHFSSKH